MFSTRQLKKIIGCTAFLLAVVLLFSACHGWDATVANAAEAGNTQDGLWLYRDFSKLRFDGEKKKIQLANENSGTLVLVYWASWCPYCEDAIRQVDKLAAIAAEEGAKLVLVNKLDGEKETKESARAYLDKHAVKTESWYDDGLTGYEALGLGMVPSLLVFDAKNRLMGFTEGEMPAEEAFRSMLRNAATGNDARLMAFAKDRLLEPNGGVISGISNEVLSESQGLMMLAALNAGDTALYETLYAYTEQHKTAAGLARWTTDSQVNALVDDLRIYRAMDEYGVDAQTLEGYARAIYDGNTTDGMPVDFFDADAGQKAARFTLCYGDFDAMARLGKRDKRWEDVRKNALKLVEGGRISNEFPLYHSWYDYESGRYRSETLHMGEAMLTLLHLSRAGRLPAEALGWLQERMADGYLYARYDTDGRPNKEGHFESAAVYAIIVGIGLSEGQHQLALWAATRMETLRVQDAKNNMDGAFGTTDKEEFYAFDQLTALLAYQELRGV